MRRVFSDIEEGGESLHVGFEHHEELEEDQSGGKDVGLRGVGGGLLLLGRGVGLGADAGGERGVEGVWWGV